MYLRVVFLLKGIWETENPAFCWLLPVLKFVMLTVLFAIWSLLTAHSDWIKFNLDLRRIKHTRKSVGTWRQHPIWPRISEPRRLRQSRWCLLWRSGLPRGLRWLRPRPRRLTPISPIPTKSRSLWTENRPTRRRKKPSNASNQVSSLPTFRCTCRKHHPLAGYAIEGVLFLRLHILKIC